MLLYSLSPWSEIPSQFVALCEHGLTNWFLVCGFYVWSLRIMFGQKIQDLEAIQTEMKHALYRLNLKDTCIHWFIML